MIKLEKRQGSSTILVLFMIVVLVTLGFFTIVSASLNYKLSLKTSQWNKSYYELDSKGEIIKAKIDEACYRAEQEAVKYVMVSGYNKKYSDVAIPEDIHNINKKLYAGNINNVYDVLNNTYKSLANIYLKDVEDEFGGEVVTLYNEDGSVFSIYYKNILQKDDDSTYKLDIKLNIQDILYDISIEPNEVSGKKVDFKNRYSIEKWKQYYDK